MFFRYDWPDAPTSYGRVRPYTQSRPRKVSRRSWKAFARIILGAIATGYFFYPDIAKNLRENLDALL